jgi:DNA-binding NarL/FixJ family response regulator
VIKILHADDHPLFREGIRFFLKLLDGQVTALEAGSFQATVDQLALEWPVDLLLLDLEMPGMNLTEGFQAIRRRYPELPIAIVSGITDANIIRSLIDGGARGFIPKLSGSEQLLDALRRILAGEIYVPEAMLVRPAVQPGEGGETLTARQLDILPLLADGLPNKQIADALGVTEGTVKQHLKDLFKRLSARNRTQAVREARRMGLLRK